MPYILRDDRDMDYLTLSPYSTKDREAGRSAHLGWSGDQDNAVRFDRASEAEGMRHAAAAWLRSGLADFTIVEVR